MTYLKQVGPFAPAREKTPAISQIAHHLKKGNYAQAKDVAKHDASVDVLSEKLKDIVAEAEVAKAFADQVRENAEQLKKTQSLDNAAREARKNRAKAKIQQLKQEMQMLKMMARLNPEAAAKRLAQISKELAAAVKEYAAASGGVGVGSAGGVTSTPSISAPVEASQGEQVSTPVTSDASVIPVSEVEAEGQGETAKQAVDPQNLKTTVMQQVGEMQRKAAQREEDRQFVQDVKDLKRQIKNLLKIIKQEMQQKAEEDDNRDIESVEKALIEVERALSVLSTGGETSQSTSVNLTI